MTVFRAGFWNQPLPALVLLSLLAALTYSHTFSVPFLFDDTSNIVENPQIKDLSHFRDLSNSRYVGFLSFGLNYYFGGLEVFGYHLVNLLIHITNGFLVYCLVWLLLRTTGQDSPPWVPLASALLFISHPIQTQAVTYLVQRFASLATLFYLSAVVCYLKWRIAPPSSRTRYVWYAGALLSVVLAMKTKEIGFTLPFMILLVEIVFFRPLTRSRWVSLVPFVLTLPIIPLSLPGALGEAEGFARETSEISRSSYLFTEFRVIITYLRLLVLPIHQNLDYAYPIRHSLFDLEVFLSFLFLSSLFALSLYLLFSQSFQTSHPLRLTAFGILWFFLTLSIESSIIPIRDVIFEHRLYLPSVGFFLSGSVAFRAWSQYRDSRYRWIMITVALILITILPVSAYQRNRIWQNEITLWTDVTLKSPANFRGHNVLGVAYKNQGRLDEAIKHYQTALKLYPNYAEAHNNLGEAYYKQGKFEEAIKEFEIALRLKPNSVAAHNNLGLIYYAQGRIQEAVQAFQAALRFEPTVIKPRLNLARAYAKLGRIEEALFENGIASKRDPDNAEVYINLGTIYHGSNRLQEAMGAYQIALRLNPGSIAAHNNLGGVYDAMGRFESAIQEYQIALRLNPNYSNAHYNLGLIYQKMFRLEKARMHYQQALRIKPDLEVARKALESLGQK